MLNSIIRDYMHQRHGVAAGASDDCVVERMAALVGSGEIGLAEYADLLRAANEWDRRDVEATRSTLAGRIKSLLGQLSPAALPPDVDRRIAGLFDGPVEAGVGRSVAGQPDGPHRGTAVNDQSNQFSSHQPKEGNSMSTGVTSNDVVKLAADTDDVRVKDPSERYARTKSVGKHVRTGRPVSYRGRETLTLSELETAKAGVFLKYLGARAGINVNMSEHERSLLEETIHEDSWCGKVGAEWRAGLSGHRVKALLDDSTSGGQEIAPEWFDEALISYPLLHSEILPEVDLRDVPRSSSVEGAAVGSPSVTWGTAEGSALSLFDTANLVSELNTSVHPVAVGIEVGNDFLSDAAVNVGDTLLENIGQRMLQELDRVIVAGDGTSEPQGIVNASGVVDITAQTPTTGPLTYDDALNLSFGVGKPYRAPGFRPSFVMTDTSYKRFRAIATGVTGDSRPLFGMNVKSYELVEYPVKIEQTGLSNNQIIFGALGKYRLYRRAGVESRFTREGQTLTLKNTSLLYVRGRFGGRVTDGNAFAVMDSAPA